MSRSLVLGEVPCYRFCMKRVLFLALLFSAALSAAAIAQDKKVEIFVTDWCPYCTKLESFLKKHHIEYTRYNVEKSEEGSRIFSELGGIGVPLVRVGSTVIPGYDPEALMEELKVKA